MKTVICYDHSTYGTKTKLSCTHKSEDAFLLKDRKEVVIVNSLCFGMSLIHVLTLKL